MIYKPDLERATPERIRTRQLERLNELLDTILPENRFYARKFDSITTPLDWDQFEALPFTTKSELVADQAATPPLGTIATYERARYITYHQTSRTTGKPLTILDTEESWNWWAECWQYVYHGASLNHKDRLFLAFSFGPFIGFWAAHNAGIKLGALTIPGGGLDSKARLHLLRHAEATALLSTPTYALRLAEVARDEGVNLTELGVRATIHAGEPGASIPTVRAQIETAWGAQCFDHAGATEIGAYGFTCEKQCGLHLIESEFIIEILDPTTNEPVDAGEIGELIITNLGRPGWPVIRYRTGDLVRGGGRKCGCTRTSLMVPDGLIGRADDLMVVRGINIYPSSIEAIVREFKVDEFRIVRTKQRAMEEVHLEIEAAASVAPALSEALSQRLAVRIPTTIVSAGTLPRFDLKANRIVDHRKS